MALPVIFYLKWKEIDVGASSTAAIGYLFVPFVAAIQSLFFAALGYALGSVIRAGRTRDRRHVQIAVACVTLSIFSLAYVGVEAVRDQDLAKTVNAIGKMDDAELRTFLDSHQHRTNRYALGAVATNEAASGATLARIALLDDPALHKKMGGTSELMAGNRKGLAVMRLVQRHSNVEPATLVLLATSPDPYVKGDVAGNRLTPREVLERLYRENRNSQEFYLIEWGLAYNVSTPANILEEMATQSRQQYTLSAITNNAEAPDKARKLAAERIKKGDFNPY